MRLKIKLILLSLLIGMSALTPLAIAADGPNSNVDCSEASASAFCRGVAEADNGTNPLFGQSGVLTKTAQVLTVVTGIISMFILTIAGLRFIRSSGDPAKIEEARNAIIFAVIGIIITISGQAIVSLVLNKL